MARKSNKISAHWIRETRDDFRAFLDETDFPDPERFGERGPVFKYPEWLIIGAGTNASINESIRRSQYKC